MTRRLSRRTMLRGVGTALALPWLEAMGPMVSWAEAPAARTPNRLAFFYVPNGVNMQHWTPRAEGALEHLPSVLAPLSSVKEHVLVLTGLTADKARPNGDGPGDHARAMAAFLTGCQPRKTDGADIRAGVSADQVAASRIGDQTRLSSLEIGCDQGNMAGNCDSGYSCAYSNTLSWRSATTPVPKLNNPRQIFDRLFGNDSGSDRARRERERRSILDYVREDSTSLQSRLGASDRRKLEEYFTAIRDVESRIDRAGRLPQPATPNMPVPSSVPGNLQEHMRLLCDLLVLAFQTDSTRVATFVFANEGSNRPYSLIGVPEGHHDLSHHGNDPAKLDKIRRINVFHMTQYAYLLEKLKSIREGDGTLLDHCMLVYGSGNSDGNRHNHDDLPILLAGKGCGNLRSGRHVRYRRDTPLNNLWLALLERMNCNIERLGDSTGTLSGLA